MKCLQSDDLANAESLKIGDTVLIFDGPILVGFAVCHYGKGSEASDGVCYIKVAAVRPGQMAANHFDALINACTAFAKSKNAVHLFAGINTAREGAFKMLLFHDYKIESLTVSMHKPNEPFYDRPSNYVIDDWR